MVDYLGSGQASYGATDSPTKGANDGAQMIDTYGGGTAAPTSTYEYKIAELPAAGSGSPSKVGLGGRAKQAASENLWNTIL